MWSGVRNRLLMRSKIVMVGLAGVIIAGILLLLGQRTRLFVQPSLNAKKTQLSISSNTLYPSFNQTSSSLPGSNTAPSSSEGLEDLPDETPVPSSPQPNLTVAFTPTITTSNPTVAYTPINVTSNPTEAVIGELPTPPGRSAMDILVFPLQFSNIRIFANPESGNFAGSANVKNMGNTFLNKLVISWEILNSVDQVLDQGQITWPNLAPTETATVVFNGTIVFTDTWTKIEFSYQPE